MENDKSYLFATYLSCNSKTKAQIKKKFKSETPSKMTQIIKRNYKKHDFSLLLQRTGNLH